MEIIIKNLSDQEKHELQIPASPINTKNWTVWECEPSSFDWHYPEQESAYIYEGQVIVKTEWEEVEINEGDYVVFPKGLKCLWEVEERIVKVYKFE